MGRNFHHLHVHAPTTAIRERVEAAVVAYAEQAGFERVARASNADRVIRLGGTGPWLSITDDGYEIESIAKAISKTTKRPILEAYCEASAIVWLGFYANGRAAGGWSTTRRPPAKLVAPLLVKGSTPAQLAKEWDEGRRQTFPETALAIAAKHFDMSVERMFLDVNPRGKTIALRRKRAAWKPVYKKGPPSFQVGWSSNQCWGPAHLVFEEQLEDHRIQVRSTGGPSHGVKVWFGGSAIEQGLVAMENVACEGLTLVKDGDAWFDAGAAIPAGLVHAPDTLSMGRREADKARALEWKTELVLALEYRGLKEGAGEITAFVETGGFTSEGSQDLRVMWKPWRPSTTRDGIDQYQLFNMHRREHSHLHIALRGTLAEAWAWARPHIEAWAVANEDKYLRVSRDGDTLLAENLYEQGGLSFDRVPDDFPTTRNIPFQASGQSFLFGTFMFTPWRMDPREELVAFLVLGGRNENDEVGPHFATLSTIADDAMVRGVAYSAVVAAGRYMPNEKTMWEDITVPTDDPLKMVRWHEQHIRGLDKRMWLSAEHAALVDRDALAKHATVTSVGAGIRINVADDQPRRTLAPLEELLAPLLSSETTIAAWQEMRAAELAAMPQLPAPATSTPKAR